jgi:hypothetical protein
VIEHNTVLVSMDMTGMTFRDDTTEHDWGMRREWFGRIYQRCQREGCSLLWQPDRYPEPFGCKGER